MPKNTGRGSRRDWKRMLVPSEQAVAWWVEGSRDPGRYLVRRSLRGRVAVRIGRLLTWALIRIERHVRKDHL